MSQTVDSNQALEWLTALINVCRETQFAFEAAAGGMTDRLLRAELLQYSGQRREFIADLTDIARNDGTRLVEPARVREPLQRQSANLRAALDRGDALAALSECERAESAAINAYRGVLALSLPAALHALVHTQLAAMVRVRNRLQRLRANARSDRN